MPANFARAHLGLGTFWATYAQEFVKSYPRQPTESPHTSEWAELAVD
jgi:hypothetical protein